MPSMKASEIGRSPNGSDGRSREKYSSLVSRKSDVSTGASALRENAGSMPILLVRESARLSPRRMPISRYVGGWSAVCTPCKNSR